MNLKFLGTTIRLLSSKEFLLYLIGGWIIYYITLAMFSKEAFSQFTGGIVRNPFIQVPYVVFLISLCLNFIQGILNTYRKGKAYLIFWFFLPFGIIVFFASFFVSLNTRKLDYLIVGEGQVISPQWETSQYLIKEIPPVLSEGTFDVEPDKGIFAYEPKIILVDKEQKSFEVGAYPPKKIGATYYHILNFGLAPGIRLFKDNNMIDEGYMPQKILPPGVKDWFEIQPYPYRFFIKLAAEKITGSRTKLYNFKSPAYEVSIFKGEKLIWEGNSKDDITFDKNMRLSFFQPSYWVLLEVISDSAFPFIVSGLVFITIGIPARIILVLIKRL